MYSSRKAEKGKEKEKIKKDNKKREKEMEEINIRQKERTQRVRKAANEKGTASVHVKQEMKVIA